VILGVVLGGLSLALVYPQISSRVNIAYSDITSYTDKAIDTKKRTDTSVGTRFELWKSASYSFLDKPILGQGFGDNLNQAKMTQVKKGLVAPVVLGYTRAHNQFFEDLQKKGILGLIILVALFLVPLSVFRKCYRDQSLDTESRYFALMGQCHVIAMMGYCLTQHYLNHHSGIVFYVTGTAIFASLCIASGHHRPKKVIG
jgi:O-antigen ligase